MAKKISRKVLEKFIAQKKLHDVVGFLHYVAKPVQAKNFMDQAKIKMQMNFGRRLLFHGSQKYHEKLIASSKEKKVYATDDPNYAIFLASINLKNASASVLVERKHTRLTVDSNFITGKSSLRKGWVFILSSGNFKKAPNHEYVSKESVEILFAIFVSPSDLTVPINIETKL